MSNASLRVAPVLALGLAAIAGCTGSGPVGLGEKDAGADATGAGGTGGGGGGPALDAGAEAGGGAGGRVLSTNRDDFFGATRCAAAGVLLCEDFEGTALDTQRWQKGGNGTATIDATRAGRGAQSLHVHSDTNGFAYLKNTSLFPVAGNTLFGRMLIWFDTMPTAPQWAHWTVAEGAGDASGDGTLLRVGGQYDGKTNRFGVGSDGGPTGDWTNLDGDPQGAVQAVPTGDWVCLEWMWNGASGETRFWWDGVEHPSLATTTTSHGGAKVDYVVPDLKSVWVGWWLYQSGSTPDHFDVWIDEVAFDTSRIGCSL
jgi:hypothetical protein